jgi:hypothetical protein
MVSISVGKNKKKQSSHHTYRKNNLFQKNKKNGFLTHKYSNGIYQGSYVNDKRDGDGVMVYNYHDNNVEKYSGLWKDDKWFSKGEIIMKDGTIYNGQIKNGEPGGQCEINYPDGDKYIGECICDPGYQYLCREGSGKMIYKNGDIQDGHWYDHEFNGQGYIHYANGNKVMFHNTLSNYKNLMLIERNDETFLQYTNKAVNTIEIEKLPFKVHSFDELFLINFNEQVTVDDSDLTNDEKKIIECPVSLDLMIEPIITSCNHAFCRFSLEKCNNICPLCRTHIMFVVPNNDYEQYYKKIKYIMPKSGKTIDSNERKNIGKIQSMISNYNKQKKHYEDYFSDTSSYTSGTDNSEYDEIFY